MAASRLDLNLSWPEGVDLMWSMSRAIHKSGLEHGLVQLIDVRASQLNGCAYCLDMHTKDARALGETEQRLFALSAWRETPFFSERERAALALTEAITLMSETHVPDDVVEGAREHFTDEELARVLFAIVAINSWNRLMVAARAPVGEYVSRYEARRS